MPHPSEHDEAARALDVDEAAELAETLKALASPSRLRVLYALSSGELSVEALAEACGLSQSATSHNLRLLRSIKLVRARRDGRRVFYALYDHHVPELLAAIRHHHEHLAPPAPTPLPATLAGRPTRR
ncbi:MAG: metalloregulator ArsR/SmtB family transcription factor [Patulibacter minatonensis]